MNAKTEQQIANLKTQTIGVEIEMNHITRKNGLPELAADHFGTGQIRIHRTAETATSTWSAWDARGHENGNFKRTSALQECDSRKVRTGNADSALRGH